MFKSPNIPKKPPTDTDQGVATRVILYAVRAGKESEFQVWQKSFNEKIQQFPGFLGMDLHQPSANESTDEWIIVYQFENEKLLKAWLDSKERTKALATAPDIFYDKQSEYTINDKKAPEPGQTIITSHKVIPGKEAEYETAIRALNDTAKSFPGFVSCETFQPTAENDEHTVLLHFNNKKNMDKWLNSPERKAGREVLYRTTAAHNTNVVGTGFGSWFAFNAEDGIAAAAWKQTMVVICGLFPVVMILANTIGNFMNSKNVAPAYSIFITSALSTIILTWVAMPVLSRIMDWWLSPKSTTKQTSLGLFLIIMVYAIEIILGRTL
jgi:hypothetical protein